MSIIPSSEPVYTHPCTLPRQSLWFGKASLFDDRIVIRGWTWQGRFKREIAVDRIKKVDWRPRPNGPNMSLILKDDRVMRMRLKRGGGLWNSKLHDLLGQSMTDRHSLNFENGSKDEKSRK